MFTFVMQMVPMSQPLVLSVLENLVTLLVHMELTSAVLYLCLGLTTCLSATFTNPNSIQNIYLYIYLCYHI